MKQSLLLLTSTIFLCLSFQFASSQTYVPGQAYFGSNNYIEYRAGNIPVIISAPHGGYLAPASIPDRNCSGCVVLRDRYTQEIAVEIDSAMRQFFGGYPHVIVNKLARIKLDANREIVEAAQGNADAETAWYEYHAFIQAAKDSLDAQYGTALFIDLHGHGHTIQRLEIGYLLSKSTLQMSDAALDAGNFQNQTGFPHLVNVLNPGVSFASILRGPQSLGGMYMPFMIPAVPSPAIPAPATADPYFIGGYNVRRHGSRDSSTINAIQIEMNDTGVRDTRANRKAFARMSACIFRDYVDTWFFPWDTLSPGLTVTNTNDMGPGSLRFVVGAAHAGDTVRFSPALHGDTIHLNSPVVPCADMVLFGPGWDSLTISGRGLNRIVEVPEQVHLELRGLSLARGRSPLDEDGGAIHNAGTVLLIRSRLVDNFGDDDGGAIVNVGTATTRTYACRFDNNACGGEGGALRSPSGQLFLATTSFSGNRSGNNGGAISNGGACDIQACTFSGNHADGNGGAVRTFNGTVRIELSTLYGNSADVRGGAVSMTSDVQVLYSTIKANTGVTTGGGIRVVSGMCTLHSSLVAENVATADPDVSVSAGMVLSQGYNFVSDSSGSDWQGFQADLLGNSAAPLPSLTDTLADNGGPTWTVALLSGSMAIDQGDSVSAPFTDQRGLPRNVNGVDIGAFELGPMVGLPPVPVADLAVVFPNPMRERATLRLAQEISGPVDLRLTDVQGRICLRRIGVVEREVVLTRGQLPAGIYFLQVRHALGEQVVPLILW